MALNIAASQMMASPVDQFIEGRALKRAEEEGAMRMTALQNAEGRAAAEETRQQSRFNWEQAGNKVKMDQATAQRTLAAARQVLAVPKGKRKAFVEKNFPDFVTGLADKQYGWEETDEDEIDEMANGVAAQAAASLGMSPEKPSPFSDPGKIAADVRSGLLSKEQGEAGIISALQRSRVADDGIGNVNPGDYTPESLAAYLKTRTDKNPFGDPGVLKRFVAPQFRQTDQGGATGTFDLRTGGFVPSVTPERNLAFASDKAEAVAGGTVTGKEIATAKLDLPKLESNANFMLKSLKELKEAPGFDRIFGATGAFPNFPGSEASNAQARLDQVRGKTFLQAYETLKGGGQITEVEGEKAENAIARLQKTQSPEEARNALLDLEEVVSDLLRAAKRKAGSAPAQRDFTKVTDADLLKEIGL